MKNARIRKGESGFSLVELLATLGIIGVLSATSIPTYQEYVFMAHTAATIKMLQDTRSVCEAGIGDLEEQGQTALFYTGRMGGRLGMPADGHTLCPGLSVKNHIVGMSWNPVCRNGNPACFHQQVFALHCKTQYRRTKTWWGDGRVTETMFKNPASCSAWENEG